MKRICFVAIPRSGTNHLCEVMANFTGLRPQFELFSKDAVYTLNGRELAALSQALGTSLSGMDDPKAIAFAKRAPGQLLDILEQAQPPEITHLSYKVFPNHLEPAKIRQELISHRDTVFAFVVRPLIDCYISMQKAQQVQCYKGTDTSRLTVELSVPAYLKWVGDTANWFNWWEKALAEQGITPAIVPYSMIKQPVPELLTDLRGVLNQAGADLSFEALTHTGLERQDRAPSYRDKIANYDQFANGLRDFGIVPPEVVAACA